MGRERLRVFVACGTGRRFGRLLDAVTPIASDRDIELFVQRGEAAADFARLPGAASLPREQFAARLRWADAVITHGGAGALHEAIGLGHTPLVMARLARFDEHVNDHQEELVRALGRRGYLRPLVDPVSHALLSELRDARRTSRDAARPTDLVQAVRQALEQTSARRGTTRRVAERMSGRARALFQRLR